MTTPAEATEPEIAELRLYTIEEAADHAPSRPDQGL